MNGFEYLLNDIILEDVTPAIIVASAMTVSVFLFSVISSFICLKKEVKGHNKVSCPDNNKMSDTDNSD